MPVLCQLSDPEHYVPFDWDITHDVPAQRYWIDLYSNFTENIRRHLHDDGLEGDSFEERWAAFLQEYQQGIRDRRENPDRFDLSTVGLSTFRQIMLNRHGFADPFQRVKRRENELACKLYPAVIAKVDQLAPAKRWGTLVGSIFAGNMFDLGSPKTIELHRSGGLSYERMLERVPPRPWHIDNFDALVDRLASHSYKQVLFFADNAGLDIVLGVIPVVRELARQAMPVVLAVNSAPALNDITLDELDPLLDHLGTIDTTLADLRKRGMLRTIASGGGIPLIDFRQVSPACNEAAAASDLIVIEGMGRGVEGNWRQKFKCDVWRVAVVKDECVARWIGGRLFDTVCRFDPAPPERGA